MTTWMKLYWYHHIWFLLQFSLSGYPRLWMKLKYGPCTGPALNMYLYSVWWTAESIPQTWYQLGLASLVISTATQLSLSCNSFPLMLDLLTCSVTSGHFGKSQWYPVVLIFLPTFWSGHIGERSAWVLKASLWSKALLFQWLPREYLWTPGGHQCSTS